MSGLILGGDLMFDRFNAAGQKTGRIYLGNCTELTITEPTELKERESRGRDTFGAALDAKYIKKPTQISVTIDEFNKHTRQIAFLGETVSVTQTAGATGTVTPVVDEAVTADLDVWVALAHGNIEYNTFVLTSDDGLTTYVEGTDYNLDRVVGRVRALTSGNILDSEALKADYSYVAPGDIDATARLDAWVKLQHEELTNGSVVVKNEAGSTTYVLGTDYTLNLRLGMIQALSTGSIANGQALKVRYQFGDVSKTRTRGGVLASVEGELFLDGKNLVTGEDVHLLVPKSVLAPSNGVSLINSGGDFGSFQASGRCPLLPGEDAPYYLDEIPAA
jgi:hypothetical protein